MAPAGLTAATNDRKVMNQHSPIVTADIADVVAGLRAEVARLHAELPRWGLVVWTAGNVSARVPGQDLLVIKPSGCGL